MTPKELIECINEFNEAINAITELTPGGRVHKAIDWNFESQQPVYPRVEDDDDPYREPCEGVPYLFDTDIESERQVRRWIEANRRPIPQPVASSDDSGDSAADADNPDINEPPLRPNNDT